MYKIISLSESNRKNKRYAVIVENLENRELEKFHFGLKNGSTYLEHKDKKKEKIIKKGIIIMLSSESG